MILHIPFIKKRGPDNTMYPIMLRFQLEVKRRISISDCIAHHKEHGKGKYNCPVDMPDKFPNFHDGKKKWYEIWIK